MIICVEHVEGDGRMVDRVWHSYHEVEGDDRRVIYQRELKELKCAVYREDSLGRYVRQTAKNWTDPLSCIHTPSRCNGGGYDGCACGPYEGRRTA